MAGLGSLPQRGRPPCGLEERRGVSVGETAATFIPFMSYIKLLLMAAAALHLAPLLPVVFRLGSGAAGAPIHGTSVSAASLDFAAAGLISQALPSMQSSMASSTLSAALDAAAGPQPPTTTRTWTTSASPLPFASSRLPPTTTATTSSPTFATTSTRTSSSTFCTLSPPSTSSTSTSASTSAPRRAPRPVGGEQVGAASPPPGERALGHSVSPSAQQGASEAKAKHLRPPLLSRKMLHKVGLSESQPQQQQQHTTTTANSKRPGVWTQVQRGASGGQEGLLESRPTSGRQDGLKSPPGGGSFTSRLKDSTPQPRRLNKVSIPTTGKQVTFTTTGNEVTSVRWALGVSSLILMLSLVSLMMPNNGSIRDPPSWSPELESRYPFRDWVRDVYLWTQATTLGSEQQMVAAIILRLGGAARQMANQMTPDELQNGGNGVGPVQLLINGLSENFAPFGEEASLRSISELTNFHRQPGEAIDALISRFTVVRHHAANSANFRMDVPGYATIIFRACGVTPEQMLQALQPLQGRMPTTDAEFNSVCSYLRRMGHVLEAFPHNIASSLGRSRGAHSTLLGVDSAHDPSSPWQNWDTSGLSESPSWTDPWANPWAQTGGQSYPVQHTCQSSTDSDTSSDDGEDDLIHAYPANGTDNERANEIYWQYSQAKRLWRRFTQKPTRKVRRFVRKKGGKKQR